MTTDSPPKTTTRSTRARTARRTARHRHRRRAHRAAGDRRDRVRAAGGALETARRARSARSDRRRPAARSPSILQQNAPGAFAVTYYPGEAALRAAIRDREVYGGISFGPDGRTLLIATGGSPIVAQLLTQVGNGIAQQAGVPLRTEDLAPPTADDPRGAGLAASALPITWPVCCRRSRWCWCSSARCGPGSRRWSCSPGGRWTIAALLRLRVRLDRSELLGRRRRTDAGVLAAGLFMLGLGSLFGRVGLALGALAGAAAGQPAVRPEQRTGAAAARWGRVGAVVAAGRQRHAAALDGILRRCRAPTTAIVVLTCWAVAGAVLDRIAAVRNGKAVPAPKLERRGTRRP